VNQDTIRDVLNLDENYSPLLVVSVGE